MAEKRVPLTAWVDAPTAEAVETYRTEKEWSTSQALAKILTAWAEERKKEPEAHGARRG